MNIEHPMLTGEREFGVLHLRVCRAAGGFGRSAALVCRGLVSPCGPAGRCSGKHNYSWKLRGFRRLRLFFSCFHAFFTCFSGASAVVFAGCAKTGCFFIFFSGTEFAAVCRHAATRKPGGWARWAEIARFEGTLGPLNRAGMRPMCPDPPRVPACARVCPLAIIYLALAGFPLWDSRGGGSHGNYSRSNAPRSGRGVPPRSAWDRLGPDIFFQNP